MGTSQTGQDNRSSALTTATDKPAAVDHSRTSVRLLRPIAEPAVILEAQNLARQLIQQTLQEGRDYGKVPGVERSTLLKPGAERIALSFGCKYGEPEIVEKEIDHDRLVAWNKRKKEWSGPRNHRTFTWKEESGTSRGLYRYVVRRAVIDIDTGRIVGHGIGSCSTMESKYIDRPRDSENTALKIASKRAMVDACLTTFGLSDQFTQDVEDMPNPTEHEADANRDAEAVEAITPDTAWPNGVNKDTPIRKLPTEFLTWAAQPGRKFGDRTAEWSKVCADVLAQRQKCEKLSCDPEGKWHDEACNLYIETDMPTATEAASTAAPQADTPATAKGE